VSKRKKTPTTDADSAFKHPEDHGIPLDQLSEGEVQSISSGADPYAHITHEQSWLDEAAQELEAAAHKESVPIKEAVTSHVAPVSQLAKGDRPRFEVCPASIVEAILFVGSTDNLPAIAENIAALMRGVRAEEIDEIVQQLNERYEQAGAPYEVVAEKGGYRLVLRSDFAELRNKFYNRIEETQLSQQAIDVLAVVAYQQPITREQVDKLRMKPSGSVLSQLVRRKLLQIEKTNDKPRRTLFRTTERFLKLFQIESLDDLPNSQRLEIAD
jgi:segregation and condensation protein B